DRQDSSPGAGSQKRRGRDYDAVKLSFAPNFGGSPNVFSRGHLLAEEPQFKIEIRARIGWSVQSAERPDISMIDSHCHEPINDDEMRFVWNDSVTIHPEQGVRLGQ